MGIACVRWLTAGFLLAAGGVFASAQEAAPMPLRAAAEQPVPRIFYTKKGQFEIIVLNADEAQQALALGRSVWRALEAPLGLPADGFSSSVSVRLVPADQWTSPSPFIITVEAGGQVNVSVRWSKDADPLFVRRAFVQGVILRQAVSWNGTNPNLTVPLWLEQACTAWSLVRERPAMRDLFQQESAGITVPPLRSLLLWERGAVESRGWELSSLWLFLQLQAEATDPARWGGWVRGIVGGADPLDTLPRSYSGLWTDALTMELWWQTAFHHQRTLPGLPVMTAAASRSWLADRSRWLAGRNGREVVLPLSELADLRKEPWVKTELTERVQQTRSVLGVIHPFYANAAISMGRVYSAALKGDAGNLKEAMTALERDAIDARELEDAVGAMLDTAPRK
ncbi:hypothetical protein [Rariglobus hedericola]|uniref:Uncharacterized protein n=1 Tax=Rariglobus hedericola TaxID=2597822 RepID=A0A556QQ04_9BACT|nr:hypothetical protein [Rariglobus hedericola]TSJ78725.1 hypothetical protein FPL22_05305 [Rariglobus hedericola]